MGGDTMVRKTVSRPEWEEFLTDKGFFYSKSRNQWMKLDGENVTKVRFLSENKVTFKHDSPALRNGKAVLGMYETEGPVDIPTLETGFKELDHEVKKRSAKKPKRQPKSRETPEPVTEAPKVKVEIPVPVVEVPKVPEAIEIPVGLAQLPEDEIDELLKELTPEPTAAQRAANVRASLPADEIGRRLDELAPKEEDEMVELAAPDGDKGEAKAPVAESPVVEVIVKPGKVEGETMVTQKQIEETKESVSKELDIPVADIDEEEVKELLEEEEELQAADERADAVKPCSHCDEVAKEIEEQKKEPVLEMAAPKIEDTPVELPETPADEIVTEEPAEPEKVVELAAPAPNPPTSILPEEGAQSFASPAGDTVKGVESAAEKAEKVLVEEPLKELAEDSKVAEKTVEKTVGFGAEELKEIARSDWVTWAMGLGLTVGPLLYAAYYQSRKGPQ